MYNSVKTIQVKVQMWAFIAVLFTVGINVYASATSVNNFEINVTGVTPREDSHQNNN